MCSPTGRDAKSKPHRFPEAALVPYRLNAPGVAEQPHQRETPSALVLVAGASHLRQGSAAVADTDVEGALVAVDRQQTRGSAVLDRVCDDLSDEQQRVIENL